VIEMDAASNNSVDDIRDLREKVAYAPVSGRHKVYILDEAMARQESHPPHGETVGPPEPWPPPASPWQLSEDARIFAIDVLPVPREPTNRYAWWTLSCAIALRSVRTTWSWPTTSAKVRGRWLRYSDVEAGTDE
jgi:hypothetical protein